MGSITGLKKGKFTSIDNSGQLRVGPEINPGTAGQALVSGGPDEPARWDTHTGTIQPLTIGANLSLASGNPTFDGGTADTLNATDTNTQLNLTGGDGITITNTGGLNRTITTDNDGFTIRNTGGQNEVLRVPNALTAGTNINFSSGTTYDGSSAITISAIDNDNQLNLTGGNGITITNTGGFNRSIAMDADGSTLSDNVGLGKAGVLKVPNALTAGTNISFSSGTTYDGSTAITINASDTDTTYQGGTGISIDTTTNPDTINASNIPNSALQNSTISGKALGTNLANLTFYDSGGGFITSYNGADPPTSITLDGDTTYQGGTNITIDTTTNPDTINLNASLTNINSISFTNSSGTTLTGSNASGTPTIATYIDLSSTTNIIPGAVLATKVQRSTLIRSFSTTYAEYSSNFRTSFVAQSSNVMVEFRAIVRADNRLFYGGLYDYVNSTWNTDTRNRFNYNDESDQDFTVNTWWMRNLTPGNTYYISPYFRGNSSFVYMYTGHGGATDGYAPAILRIYDGGNNVNVY